MKRIVVPIDYSSYSENAFLTAADIAARGDATITCINVVTASVDWNRLSPEGRAKYPEILDLEAEAKEKLAAFVSDHKLKSSPVEAVVGVGIPSEVIVDIANKQKADLIVIGAYGKGYQEGRFIGSNLQRVIRTANCPVLAVKKALQGESLDKMVFAGLFNEHSKPAFDKMKPVIQTADASVHFLYVSVPGHLRTDDQVVKQMDSYISETDDFPLDRHVYAHSQPEGGIIEFCESNDIGWIGIASSTKKPHSSYQIGVTETVIYRSEIPVLSVKFE